MATSAPSPGGLPATRRRAPDFFIVGSPKTGTTSLYKTLREHPQIYMPDLKEPRFLASDMRALPGRERRVQENGYPTSMEEYLALFEGAGEGQRVGEASAFYLWSHSAAGAIADLRPDARIIAILREPASFLRSLHLMYLQWGNEGEKDLRKALALESDRSRGKRIPRHSHRPQLLQYSEHVRYTEQLSRYRARFAPEQMLVLIYEDFQRENEATLRRVLRFLDVDERALIAVKRANVTRRIVRAPRANTLLHTVSKGRGPVARSTKATIKALTSSRVRFGASKLIERRVVGTAAPPPDERVMVELRERFKPEVVALSELLGRDLVSLWGYDRLD